MVVLVAGDGKNPSTHSLSMNSLCFPRTVGLLGSCLVFGRHTAIRPAASIANEIASYYVVSWDVCTAHLSSVGSSFDNFVTLLFHAVAEFLEKFLIAVEDPRMGYCDCLENAEHDILGYIYEFDAINAFGSQQCVDLGVNRCQM